MSKVTKKKKVEKKAIEPRKREILKVVCSIRDVKTDAFSAQPFFSFTEGDAIRAFIDGVNAPDSPMHVHPNDYSLYAVGEYDQISGMLFAYDEPKHLIAGKDAYKAPVES